MTVKHSIRKARYDDGEIIDNEFTYRGVTFRRSDSVGPGYHGHYSIGGYHNGVGFTKRSEVLAHIDAQF